MKIKIKFFSIAKDLLDKEEIQLEVAPLHNLNQLKKELEKIYPSFKGMPGRFAVNLSFTSNETIINETDEIAWIPPVSGG